MVTSMLRYTNLVPLYRRNNKVHFISLLSVFETIGQRKVRRTDSLKDTIVVQHAEVYLKSVRRSSIPAVIFTSNKSIFMARVRGLSLRHFPASLIV